MNDRTSLMNAILAAPEDDTVRLAFADYLDEHGDPLRAEFIRVQIAVERTPRPQWPARLATVVNSHSVWKAHQAAKREYRKAKGKYESLVARDRWFYNQGIMLRSFCSQPLCEWGHDIRRPATHIGGRRVVWSRGFVGEVHLPAADWLQFAGEILAANPITRIRLQTMPAVDHSYPAPKFNPPAVANIRGKDRCVTMGPLERWDSVSLRLLRAEWPGIEFEVPAA